MVLVVEDEPAIASLIGLYLRREGFTVHTVGDGILALAAADRLRPVAVVLDISLPGLDGLEVCRRLRARPDCPPILFVTARDDEVDRIVGLELGGDDYVTKPFSPRELVARVKAVLRRGAPTGAAHAGDVLVVGDVQIDVGARRAWAGGAPVELTATEFDLLAHLMRNPGRVITREMLLSQVWGYAGITSRTVDVHIAQLRSKLGDASPLRTVRGVGYAADRGAGSAAGPGRGSSSGSSCGSSSGSSCGSSSGPSSGSG